MPEILESITGEQDEPRVPTDFNEKKKKEIIWQKPLEFQTGLFRYLGHTARKKDRSDTDVDGAIQIVGIIF